MGIASIARTEQVEVATTCRKFATSDLGIVNCDEIRMFLLSGRPHAFTETRSKNLLSGSGRSATSVHRIVRPYGRSAIASH